MKNLLHYASKIATTVPLAVVLMSVVTSSAMAQVNTATSSPGLYGNTNNMATGSGAIQSYQNMGNTSVGRYGSYGGTLQTTRWAAQAPYSTNSAGLPSGMFNYGFNGRAFSGLGSAATGGQYLPTTSSASNDLNIVENSNYALYGGSLGIPINVPPLVPLVNNAVINSTQALQGLNTLFGQ
ncbi:MAG: hypothetical protein P4L53_06140 [Candidatus Obscuribacterales bacterium]|nr:hypothetical protein [Candidatus Obscuribacterales bacterium]